MSLLGLAWLNIKIGFLSFGGGMTALFYHEVVVKRPVMTENEFFSGLTIAQILPGANVVNLAIYIGQRLHGALGAILAVAGLVFGPFFSVIGLFVIYDRLIDFAWISSALDGITAAAIGLLGMIVFRGVRASRDVGSLLIFVITMTLVGVLRLPLIPVVLAIIPISIAFAAYRLRRHV